jgi:predicted 3-demethylubiquinone-9 3-methyltransferase (glyoxalase superfamily)
MQKITPFLWFDNNLQDAMKFYASVFPDTKIGKVNNLSDVGAMQFDNVMTATFTLMGQEFMAMNAGPTFKFNEAISFFVDCADQKEVDYYWSRLTADGGQESQCGWLKDKFGLSWQIVPRTLSQLLSDPDKGRRDRALQAMLKMKKIDVGELERAAEGTAT